jgi:hypothetical protein
MSDLIIFENLPNSVDSLIIDNKNNSVIKEITQKEAKNNLYASIVKAYQLRKLKTNQTEIIKDTELLYEQIKASDKFSKWSINHVCLAIEQGALFTQKDVDNLNTISVAKLFNWIKSFSEYRAKVIIVNDRKEEKAINEQKAKEQEPEKRKKYLNDICNYYNSGDHKDCNNVGMRHIYFNTFLKLFENNQAYLSRLLLLREEAENECEIQEDSTILKINPKNYFVSSLALQKFFTNLEKNSIKLEVSDDLKIMLTR